MDEETGVKALFPWAGGKRSALPRLRAKLPPDWRERRLVVPFTGGGAFYYSVGREMAGRPVLADATRPLVLTHRALQADYARVGRLLQDLPVTKQQFLAVRRHLSEVVKTPSHSGSKFTVAAHFLYLMRTGFNGLWRVSSRGVNTPWGKPSPSFVVWSPQLREAAMACSAHLQATRAIIRCQDFRVTLRAALDYPERLLLFVDPPYWDLELETSTQGFFGPVPDTKESWSGYTAKGFTARDQADLLALLGEHKRRGSYVIATNHWHTQWVQRYAAEGFEAEMMMMRRNINRDGKKRGAVREVLFFG